ncbi:MAG: hypothetical protein JSW66_13610 [Phycisphaerales bacterium]|nr:MAG: hypothetical protein JSW66_13610 [Phycisphaerales bacterium]
MRNTRLHIAIIVMAAFSLALSGCKADLQVVSLTHLPKSPTTADTITFTAVVKNTGFKAAGPSMLALKVGGETYPPTYPVPALAPNESHRVQRRENLSVAQRYRNTATADVKDQVDELNENNNKRTEDYTVRAP